MVRYRSKDRLLYRDKDDKIQRIKCGNVNCNIIGENGNAVLVDTA